MEVLRVLRIVVLPRGHLGTNGHFALWHKEREARDRAGKSTHQATFCAILYTALYTEKGVGKMSETVRMWVNVPVELFEQLSELEYKTSTPVETITVDLL